MCGNTCALLYHVLPQAIDCSLIKRLVLLLFECYPHMTSSNSDITSQSLLHLLSSLNKSVLQSFLNFTGTIYMCVCLSLSPITVYHGIILTCSHPVVIESVSHYHHYYSNMMCIRLTIAVQ